MEIRVAELQIEYPFRSGANLYRKKGRQTILLIVMRLFLTDEERMVLEKTIASSKVQSHIHPAVISYDDSPEKRNMRLKHCAVVSPTLKQLVKNLGEQQPLAPSALERDVAQIDFETLSNSDLTEFLFAIGPNSISTVIKRLLSDHPARASLPLAAGLSTIREMLFGSLVKS